MKKFEFTTREGDVGHYRTVPAFMSDGIRVFGYRLPLRYDNEEFVAFNEKIFDTEEEAEIAISRVLNLWLDVNLISSYTVKNT